jgi:integrase/recombinase XerD
VESVSHVNIVKKIKVDGDWKLLSIPRNTKGNYDWNALPEGLYLIEWRAGGKRRRESAGVTAAQALEAQRRKRHELEGRKLGIPGFETAGETVKKPALHLAVNKYLEQIEALKKPNTHRKYEAVLKRFLDFFGDRDSIDAISGDDLTRFVVTLKKDHGLGSNTILHNAVIIAQFLKRHGRSGITRELPLPERITPLVKVYRHEELVRFFAACSDAERALFGMFLLSGFREQEVMYLHWSDVNFELRTVRVTAKPNLGFYPKRWEDREVPAPVELLEELRKHAHRPNCQFVFPSPTGNREQHMLDHCKAIAMRAELDPTKFDLKTFRSTYATGMLRRGFDVRTVQHWMGHKSLETTLRYLAPATDVHDELDLVTIPSIGKTAPAPRKAPERETSSPRKGRPARSPVGAASDALAAKTIS